MGRSHYCPGKYDSATAVMMDSNSRLVELGIALSAERDHNRLMERILLEAKSLTNADGGTLYLVEHEKHLSFKIIHNDSLKISMGADNKQIAEFPPIPLYNSDKTPNHQNIASSVYHERTISLIDDAYLNTSHDFSGTRSFDERSDYRSKSFLTVPLINYEQEVIAVLQLINSRSEEGDVVPFSADQIPLIQALSSQAAVALDNQQLIAAQRTLWDALIKMLASSIDDKSPYTGGHCQRVPEITKLLAKEATLADYGIFKDFTLSSDEWYELHVAAWLHDCGKITTPEYIVDKSSKLETMYNRIHEVRTRFDVLWRDAEIACLKEQLAGGDKALAEKKCAARQSELQAQFSFVATSNVGGEYMDPSAVEKLQDIGKQTWTRHFDRTVGLGPLEAERIEEAVPTPAQEYLLDNLAEHQTKEVDKGELYNLSIARGTLTEEERQIINDHISVTIRMLEGLPFPNKMRRVPEYAGGHHERMDGKGYPRGLTGDQMSIPARIMAIADVFEALTAADRPYKKAKALSESLGIMEHMAKTGHIDPDLFALFLTSGVWRTYAHQYLNPEQIDVEEIDRFLPPPEQLTPVEAPVAKQASHA